jgi:Zn-dependent M28 family amino/carboxypeptidase
LVLVCVLAWAPGAGSSATRFDAGRAWSLVRMQLSYGQRPAGSPQLQRLARALKARLPNGRYEPLPGQPGLRNIVGAIPGRKPAIVIGAHYDTLADPPGFVGANNGAAGTAIVVQVAHELATMHLARGRELRFVLFDGEEPPRGLPEQQADFFHSGLRGSRAYVEAHVNEIGAMILLDYVGNKGLFLPREGTSDRALWSKLLRAASSVGARSLFSAKRGGYFLDDHTPFLRAGIPAIDLIDPTYDGHSPSDRLDQLSRASINAVGETITELALRLR